MALKILTNIFIKIEEAKYRGSLSSTSSHELSGIFLNFCCLACFQLFRIWQPWYWVTCVWAPFLLACSPAHSTGCHKRARFSQREREVLSCQQQSSVGGTGGGGGRGESGRFVLVASKGGGGVPCFLLFLGGLDWGEEEGEE